MNQQADLAHKSRPKEGAVQYAAAIYPYDFDAMPRVELLERLPQVNAVLSGNYKFYVPGPEVFAVFQRC